MPISIKRETEHTNGENGKTVLYGSGNGTVKTKSDSCQVAFINNEPYEIKEGETIISFLRRNFGKDAVPTLCDAPNLEPFGSCRVCSVDVALKEDGPVKTDRKSVV